MKTSLDQKAKPQDWHRADIKAALEKAGWTFAALGKSRGYTRGALVNVLNTSYPKAERIVAEEMKRRRWDAGTLAERRKGYAGKLAIARLLGDPGHAPRS